MPSSIPPLVLLALSFCIACGGADSASPGPSTSGAEARAPIARIPVGVWLVVRTSEGRGLSVGSGVRFRADSFEVVSRGLGSAFPIACTGDEVWTCEAPGGSMRVEAVDGALRVSQTELVLTLDAASEAESAAFEETLVASVAQQTACRRAADCCVALENAGHPCDVVPVLGDRTRRACDAGFDTLTARIASAGIATPGDCR